MRKFMVKSLAIGLPLLVGGILPASCNISGIPGFGFVSVETDDDDDFFDDLEDLFDDDD
jgi:hypothetical protein